MTAGVTVVTGTRVMLSGRAAPSSFGRALAAREAGAIDSQEKCHADLESLVHPCGRHRVRRPRAAWRAGDTHAAGDARAAGTVLQARPSREARQPGDRPRVD